jgi:hypothetical protein
MRRLEGRSIDAVTLVHKLVGVAWVLGAAGSLAVALGAGSSSAVPEWGTVAALQTLASAMSVLTLLVGVAFSVFTAYGFFRNRLVIVKWLLFFVATGFGGPAISAAGSRSAAMVAVFTGVEIAALLCAGALGIVLERRRHSAVRTGSPKGTGAE